eukprot:760821-Hanusia_phi.AAC.1
MRRETETEYDPPLNGTKPPSLPSSFQPKNTPIPQNHSYYDERTKSNVDEARGVEEKSEEDEEKLGDKKEGDHVESEIDQWDQLVAFLKK